MPILGIIASSITGNLVTNSYESISTVTVGSGGSASVTFSSIPATYTHLQIRCLAKTDNAGTTLETVSMTVNGNSLTKNHYLYGNGSVVLAGVGGSNVVMNISSAGSTNIFGVAVIDILDYANTNKNKTIRTLSGVDLNGSGELILYSNLYAVNTNAITSLSFSIPSLNIAQYSQFALYGVRGAQ